MLGYTEADESAMFDVLEGIDLSTSEKKHMDQIVFSDVMNLLGGECTSYVKRGTMVTRKNIESTERDIRMKRSLQTSFEDALRSMAWRQLEMIVFKIEFIKKLMQPEMASISLGTREIESMSADELAAREICIAMSQ